MSLFGIDIESVLPPRIAGKIMSEAKLQSEIDNNYEAFIKLLPSLLPIHRGKFALMHDGEIVGFYSSWNDARTTGEKFHKDKYSIQEVTDKPEDLGFFSYAHNSG